MRVAAHRITKAFGPTTVLRDVTVSVDDGEVVALVGPSGTGKSTLLAIIGGLTAADSGTVERTVTIPDGPRDLCWIFQGVNLLPRRTALDNVMLGAYRATSDITDARRRAAAALTTVGLGDRAHAPIRQLSGGERQRVAVAAALIGTPGLLLADEPTAQLDRSNAELVTDAIIDLVTAGTSAIIATHDMSVAARCHRIVDLGNLTSEANR